MQHLNRLLLLAIVRGELPAGLATSIAIEHVLAFCPECRREIQLAQRELVASMPSAEPQVISTVLGRHVEGQRAQAAKAQHDLAVLLKLPKEKRKERIERARSRFLGPHFAQLLLDKSQESIASSPDDAVHYAKLALVVVMRVFNAQRDGELHVQVLAHVGNALRAAGRFAEADTYFSAVRQVIVNRGLSENPALLARVDDLEGSLRIDQRRLEKAEELLARSLILYGMADAPIPDRVRVLVNLGVVYQLQGNLAEAIDITTAALDSIAKVHGELKLSFAALYNLATFQVDLGSHQAAMRTLNDNRDIIESITEPLYLIRLIGLRGKISAARGDLAVAEEALLKTRDGFLAYGDAFAYDAAIVSLDLALLYAKQGRSADLHSTVASMIPIFQTNELHREALAAVLLLQDAVERERVPLALLHELTAYMRGAQRNPSLKFEATAAGSQVR